MSEERPVYKRDYAADLAVCEAAEIQKPWKYEWLDGTARECIARKRLIDLARTALPWYIRRCMKLETENKQLRKAWEDFQLKTESVYEDNAIKDQQLFETCQEIESLRARISELEGQVRMLLTLLRNIEEFAVYCPVCGDDFYDHTSDWCDFKKALSTPPPAWWEDCKTCHYNNKCLSNPNNNWCVWCIKNPHRNDRYTKVVDEALQALERSDCAVKEEVNY